MLRRRGRLHCFCTKLCPANAWLLTSASIVCLTLSDIYFHTIDQQDLLVEIETLTDEQPPMAPYYASVLKGSPVLPQFDGYPKEMRDALIEVYNTSFKEVAKAKLES